MSAYTENIHIEWVGFWKIGNKARQGKCNGMIVGKVGHSSRSTNCHNSHSKIYWTLRYWRYVLGCFDKWFKDWESTVGDEFPFICSSHVASLPPLHGEGVEGTKWTLVLILDLGNWKTKDWQSVPVTCPHSLARVVGGDRGRGLNGPNMFSCLL